MSFSNQSKSSTPSFSNATKSSTTFTTIAKTTGGAFGNLTFDQVGSNTFATDYHSKATGDYTFAEQVTGLTWTNQSKS